MHVRRAISSLLLLFSVALARPAHAQLTEVRGVVSDSASGAPVSAAVVMLLDANGTSLVRTLTSDRGLYRLLRPTEATQLRVVRLGFQPSTLPLSSAVGRAAGGYNLDVRLTTIARLLQQVDVTVARGCSNRGDRAGALTLLDEARAGLLAAVVAREKDPPKLYVLRFERTLDGDGVETVSQIVRVDSSGLATSSFNAVQSASDFLANGFRSGNDGDYTFFGPDADVLLDARFQAGYCFAVAAADASRPTQVGLHFTPANRRAGRVDIDGTMWIDTAARVLSDITFKYVGVEAIAEGLGAGGRIGFRALPNGVPFIDRWQLRLVGAPPRESGDTRPGPAYLVREIGGELAEARWADGRTWNAPLATVHIAAVGVGNRPAPGAQLRLRGTEYRATSDAGGHATITNVLPGPYTIVVDDPALAPLRLALPTDRTFTAVRGASLVLRLEVGGPISLARTSCKRTDSPKSDESWLFGRALDERGQPVPNVRWRVFEADEGRWKARTDVGTAGADGIMALCRGLDRGRTIEIAVWRDRAGVGDTVRVRRVIDAPLETFAALVPSRSAADAARAATTRQGPTVTLSGTVTDSITQRPTADARVHVLGSPLAGASDEQGNFVIGGLVAGRYSIEVGTAALDSVGLVSRRVIDVREGMAPLQLFAPHLPSALAAVCQPRGAAGRSYIVGQLTAKSASSSTSTSAAIAGYRVVAEWEADTAALLAADSLGQSRGSGWVRATPDATTGTYSLCDVPVGRAVVLRAESESMSAGAAEPRTVQLRAAAPVARIDLVLDTARVVAPSFSGTVLADSAGVAIDRAEVLLRDLGRSVLTDRRGQFRFSDVPIGPHILAIRAVGYQPFLGSVQLDARRTVDQKYLLPRAAQTLAAVEIEGEGLPQEFEERRSAGLGAFLTAKDIQATRASRLGPVLAQARGFGAANAGLSGGAQAFVVGKRPPQRILPRGAPRPGPDGARGECGSRSTACGFTTDDLVGQGYYCPTAGDRAQGITLCACYARVYVDNRLMNSGKPTEPFDINTIPPEQVAGIELYTTPASTPARYSQLDAVCGVMLVWTRRR